MIHILGYCEKKSISKPSNILPYLIPPLPKETNLSINMRNSKQNQELPASWAGYYDQFRTVAKNSQKEEDQLIRQSRIMGTEEKNIFDKRLEGAKEMEPAFIEINRKWSTQKKK